MDSSSKFGINKLNEIVEHLSSISKQIKDLATLVSNYNSDIEKKDFPSTLKWLPKIDEKNKTLCSFLEKNDNLKLPYIENQTNLIKSWIEKENSLKEQRGKKYTNDTLDKIGEHFKELLLKGHYPCFSSKNFKFNLDSKKYKIHLFYGGDEEKIQTFDGWNLTDLSSTLKKFYEYFNKIELNAEIKIIFDCYNESLGKKSQLSGEWVLVNEVLSLYVEKKKNQKISLPYPDRIFFSFLIFRIFNQELIIEQKRLAKRTATHAASVKKDEHLWLPLNDDDLFGENIMYLKFL